MGLLNRKSRENKTTDAAEGDKLEKIVTKSASLNAELQYSNAFTENLTPRARALIAEAREKAKKEAANPVQKKTHLQWSLSILMAIITNPATYYVISIISVFLVLFSIIVRARIQGEITPPYYTLDKKMGTYAESPSEQVARLHANLSCIVDLHSNSLWNMNDMSVRGSDKCGLWSCPRSHVDIPRLIEGNVCIQVMAAASSIHYTLNEWSKYE